MHYNLILMMTRSVIFFAAILFALLPSAALAESVTVLANGNALGGGEWKYHAFSGIAPTDYAAAYDESLGANALVAESARGASGFTRRVKIDLRKTPYMHFRWRVDAAEKGFDEKEKSGDDFAFRVYLIGKSGLIKHRLLNLVRSHGESRGTNWRSPYSRILTEIKTFVFADSNDALGEWHIAKLNAADLWKKIFGEDAGEIGGVGIMTDGDNAGVQMKARYGEIIFSNSAESPFNK